MPFDVPNVISPHVVAERITEILHGALRHGVTDRIVVARADGIVIAHSLPDEALARRLGAISAAIVGTAEVATIQLGFGGFEDLNVGTDVRRLVCVGAGDQAIVAAELRVGANVGLLLMVLREMSQRIGAVIEEGNRSEGSVVSGATPSD